MINFLFGFSVGIIVSAGVAVYAAYKDIKKCKDEFGSDTKTYIFMNTYEE